MDCWTALMSVPGYHFLFCSKGPYRISLLLKVLPVVCIGSYSVLQLSVQYYYSFFVLGKS